MKTWILMTIFITGLIGLTSTYDETEWYLFEHFDIPLGPDLSKYDSPIDDEDLSEDSDVESSNATDDSHPDYIETDVISEEDDEEAEPPKAKKPIKKATSNKKKNSKSMKNIDPNSSIKKSDYYVSPDDVEYQLRRDKREVGDDQFEYSKAYRDFVRQNFGDDSAKRLNADEEGDEESGEDEEDGGEEGENGEEESGEAEGYDEEVEEDVEDDGDGGATAAAEEVESAEDDSGYEHVKAESDKAAAESKTNSKHCKIVFKDGQHCSVCKNPKTHDESESCSYSSAPPPKRYAFKKKLNYGEADDDDEESPKKYVSKHHKKGKKVSHQEDDSEELPKKRKKKSKKAKKTKKAKKHKSQYPYTSPEYWGYQNEHKTKPMQQINRGNNYDLTYHASEPFAATFDSGEADGGNVDKVLNSFKSRDWSKCKEKKFDGFTCYYCKNPEGGTEEECMYVEDGENPIRPMATTASPFNFDENFSDNPLKSDRRKLNRNQNFRSSPISASYDYGSSTDYLSPLASSKIFSISNAPLPIKALEYKEPKDALALKRMIARKTTVEKNNPFNSSLYSKLINT